MPNPKDEPFLKNRIKSFGFAIQGLITLVKTENSVKLQLLIAIAVTVAGFYFNITTTEWLIQIAMIGLVVSIEAVNTAIEHIADFVHSEYHPLIGKIKNIAAGAVLIAGITALTTACIIYIPKLI